MENTTNLASPTARIEVVDALRGFAVLAILLVHNVEHFIYPVYPTSSPGWLEVMDLGVFHATFALFAGKSYSIFALLFGFTFFIQNENQRRRSKDFGYRFLWRMLLLMAFGTLNAAFYPAGDVLQLYALVGIILFLFRKASDRVLLVGALFFLLQPIEWYHFIASRIDVTHQLPDFGVAELDEPQQLCLAIVPRRAPLFPDRAQPGAHSGVFGQPVAQLFHVLYPDPVLRLVAQTA